MQLPDPVTFAIPAFVLLILIETAIGRYAPKKSNYEMHDSAASLLMGLGNFAIGLVNFGIVGAVALWVYQYRLFDIGYHWWAFVLILFAEDFVYYWFHRLSHEHRIWWAAHINHHSSQYYNLTTALRQTWTGAFIGTWIPWLLLSFIGFPLALILFQKGISLVYQFWIHTEAIDRMWKPVEAVMNTPSHHRVHHATNPKYLDANYAGIFIIWDKLFGSFVPEDKAEPCRYGIVKQIASFNPLIIAFHEWVGIFSDLFHAKSFKAAFMYIFGPPGWSEDGSRLTSRMIKERERIRLAGQTADAAD
ncbi:sterol desaturase family protein [Sneathiella sp. CAU 1612]|uniref:Sterol desaturase family protein n=1 Tax=Sneathiella sedimenti TaxID=2816034 RepID=A0ABS3F4P9_9PROT|nr:sterol desaturase family protein [Sneathiella sedimenti]MBO0333466.1 sterol desaturase family protein [Sneathiella sedimenti]